MKRIIVESFGRICLFGEHTDWASEFKKFNGYAIALPINKGFTAIVQKSIDFNFITTLGSYKAETINDLLVGSQIASNAFRYCCGTAYIMKNVFPWIGGLSISTINEDLPIRCGLSSSAAICILIVKAINELYNLNLGADQIMELSYQGERNTGSLCGRMDQIGVLPKCIYKMTFTTGGDLKIQNITTNNNLYLFYVNVGNSKNTSMILKKLKESFMNSSELQNYLGDYNIQIIKAAEQIISRGNAEKLGLLMTESQLQFDNVVSKISLPELLSPKFHALLNDLKLQEHIYGGKEIGSHGDGTALFIAKTQFDMEQAVIYVQKVYNYKCDKIIIFGGHENGKENF